MIRKQLQPPTTQRRFTDVWGELDYLCRKSHYWMYTRKQRAGAERYLARLERAARKLAHNDMAIIREEALALVSELKGRIAESIVHRKREIALMEQLHRDASS